jgi:Mrp family chromosome partitioning ATPase
MGRMFRVITEPQEPGRSAVGRPAAVAPAVEDVPFVEVGGPDGVLTSVITPRPVARLSPPPSVTDPTPVPPRQPDPQARPPAPSPDPRVLSVSFHEFPKTTLRLLPAGMAPELVTFHFPDHPVSGEYRAVVSEMKRPFAESGPRTLLFTAAVPLAGTTTVLLNAGVALAQEGGQRVLVVDANLLRPGSARRFGVGDGPGLAEVLGQTVPLAWAVQPTPLTNLHVLSAGSPTEATPDLLAHDLPRLLAQLRQWFDWVLVDCGVWTEAGDRVPLGSAADGVYLVTRQHDLDRPEFGALRGAVAATGGHLRGYITTRQ